MGKLVIFLSLMILVNISISNSLTTDIPSDELTTDTTSVNEIETESVTGSGDEELATTTEAVREQDTTAENEATDTDTEEHTTEVNKDVDKSTKPSEETQVTTESPPPVCDTLGQKQPHESDCRQYYECSAEGSKDGSLHLLKKSCPEKYAYSKKLKRCSRDIGSCPLNITCDHEGAQADPASNTSYYYCQKYYTGEGYYVFHVQCESYQIFYLTIGKCYADFTLPLIPPIDWTKVKDVDVVKAERKLIKEENKLVVKELKDKKKAQEKLKKQEEKLRKEQAKAEAKTFVCEKAGNFASNFADNRYIECIVKKDTFKAVAKECVGLTVFNPETGTCVAKDNSIASDDED